jgi:hypothetical protein
LPTPPVLALPDICRGLSEAKFVATIERPASHHGSFLPARKKLVILLPACFDNKSPATIVTVANADTIVQSSQFINDSLLVKTCFFELY